MRQSHAPIDLVSEVATRRRRAELLSRRDIGLARDASHLLHVLVDQHPEFFKRAAHPEDRGRTNAID